MQRRCKHKSWGKVINTLFLFMSHLRYQHFKQISVCLNPKNLPISDFSRIHLHFQHHLYWISSYMRWTEVKESKNRLRTQDRHWEEDKMTAVTRRSRETLRGQRSLVPDVLVFIQSGHINTERLVRWLFSHIVGGPWSPFRTKNLWNHSELLTIQTDFFFSAINLWILALFGRQLTITPTTGIN